ncbi:ATPase family gene 2 protein homolog A [Onthophagus taurus]|uniref:ATPase family gene 2 protein homolog A n=1 Tax=Onthophagus taurus TaxID=166361 RepID=UPI0039BEB9B9
MPPKFSKSSGLWVHCDTCSTAFLQKDAELHTTDCPPDDKNHTYDYIKDSTLVSTLDVKSNEDVKSVTQLDRDHMVFMSQSTIQICGFSIGQYVSIKCDGLKFPIARMVWPTTEKNITAVLLTKNAMDLLELKSNSIVSVSKINPIFDANTVTLILLNNQKSFVLCTELQTRISKSYAHKVIAKNNLITIVFYGRLLRFVVKSIQCDPIQFIEAELGEMCLEHDTNSLVFYQITEKTQFKLFKSGADYQKQVILKDAIDDVGGLDDEIAELNELITVGLNLSEVTINFRPTKACLLYGNSGTGKTLLTKALTKTIKAYVVSISSSDLYTKYSTSIEDKLDSSFTEADENAPSIVIFDEFDILCPSKPSRTTDSEKKIVSKVLTFFDSIIEGDKQIFIIGTTNKIDSIDNCFRRCGRFDRELEIPTPNPINRFQILKKMLKNVKLIIDEESLKKIAFNAHGFVGADLQALCSRATLHATRFNRNALEMEDFNFALTKVRPSAMREIQIEVPNVRWSDIGGQDNLKLVLKQAVEWPLKYPDCFVRMGITPPRGVLMFGPPGCSKTMIAKALATESGLNFISIKGPELFSKWVGESERAVREVFRKARQVAPSIIFFDEIDALGGERSSSSSTNVQERVLAQLLTELDGVTPLGDVTVIAATNRPDRIDKALLRPGRLDRLVLVPLPDETTRKEIFKLKLAKMPVSQVYIAVLVEKTVNYTCAEIVAVCHEAAMAALEESLNAQEVTMKHFYKALEIITPRTPDSLLAIYDDYYLKYRQYK